MRVIGLVVFSCFYLAQANAQWKEPIGTKLERRVKEKVEEKVDKTIDNALDGNLNPIEAQTVPMNRAQDYNSSRSNKARGFMPLEPGAYSPSESQTKEVDSSSEMQAQGGSSVGTSGNRDKVQDTYVFNHNVVMVTEVYNKKGDIEAKSSMKLLFSEVGGYFAGKAIRIEGMDEEMPETTSIFDMDNNQMISLMEMSGMKMAFIVGFGSENEITEESVVSFSKTGKTKSILGYVCEQYIAEDADTKSEFWVASGEDFGMSQAMLYMGKNAQRKSSESNATPDGFVLEMTSIDQKSKEKIVMKVAEVNKGVLIRISTLDYQFY
jgi:hypothetical protein